MPELKQKYTTEVKLSTQIIEKIGQLLILLTSTIIMGSLFLAVLIISSANLANR